MKFGFDNLIIFFANATTKILRNSNIVPINKLIARMLSPSCSLKNVIHIKKHIGVIIPINVGVLNSPLICKSPDNNEFKPQINIQGTI